MKVDLTAEETLALLKVLERRHEYDVEKLDEFDMKQAHDPLRDVADKLRDGVLKALRAASTLDNVDKLNAWTKSQKKRIEALQKKQ